MKISNVLINPQITPKYYLNKFQSVGFYLITPRGNCSYSYFGERCVTWFVNEILTLERIASKFFTTNKPFEITPQEEESFQQSKVCWLCEATLGDDKVRHHDHLTRKYRGAAHNRYNLNCKKSHPVLFPYFSTVFLGMIVILHLTNS